MNNENHQLLARLYLILALMSFCGLLVIFLLFLFFHDQSSFTHKNLLITGGIELILGIVGFLGFRTYSKRRPDDR